MTEPYPDEMFDEAQRREDEQQQQDENDYWRKRLHDLEQGNTDENSSDN